MKIFSTILCLSIITNEAVFCQKPTLEKESVVFESVTFVEVCPAVALPPPDRPPYPPPPLPASQEDFVCWLPATNRARFAGCEIENITADEKQKCADEKLMNFIYGNLKWPRDFCGKGMVVVRFNIEKDGSITNPIVVRDIGGGCGEEALRVVKMMPKWVPGEQQGKAVRTQFNLPVKFKLDALPVFDTVYKVADEMPRFPGCEEDDILGSKRQRCADEKMLQFIFTNLSCPSITTKEDFSSACVAKFVVEKDGSITGAQIVRPSTSELDEAFLKVIRSMPRWTPGKLNGHPVRVELKLPVKICLR